MMLMSNRAAPVWTSISIMCTTLISVCDTDKKLSTDMVNIRSSNVNAEMRKWVRSGCLMWILLPCQAWVYSAAAVPDRDRREPFARCWHAPEWQQVRFYWNLMSCFTVRRRRGRKNCLDQVGSAQGPKGVGQVERHDVIRKLEIVEDKAWDSGSKSGVCARDKTQLTKHINISVRRGLAHCSFPLECALA